MILLCALLLVGAPPGVKKSSPWYRCSRGFFETRYLQTPKLNPASPPTGARQASPKPGSCSPTTWPSQAERIQSQTRPAQRTEAKPGQPEPSPAQANPASAEAQANLSQALPMPSPAQPKASQSKPKPSPSQAKPSLARKPGQPDKPSKSTVFWCVCCFN